MFNLIWMPPKFKEYSYAPHFTPNVYMSVQQNLGIGTMVHQLLLKGFLRKILDCVLCKQINTCKLLSSIFVGLAACGSQRYFY